MLIAFERRDPAMLRAALLTIIDVRDRSDGEKPERRSRGLLIRLERERSERLADIGHIRVHSRRGQERRESAASKALRRSATSRAFASAGRMTCARSAASRASSVS